MTKILPDGRQTSIPKGVDKMGTPIFALIIFVLLLALAVVAFISSKITTDIKNEIKKTWCSDCGNNPVVKNSNLCEECQLLVEIANSRMEGME